jgi:hypothetical protein
MSDNLMDGRASDDDISAMTNSQLDALWDTVQEEGGPHRRTTDKRAPPLNKKRPSPEPASSADANIGMQAGETRFEVDELRKYSGDDRVPREDGRWTKKRRDDNEGGGYYGPRWRGEQIRREDILLSDPNYQFLNLVAGAANATVEKLYDEDSVGRVFKLRLQERQMQRAIEETRIELDDLREEQRRRVAKQVDGERYLVRLQEHARTDQIFTLGEEHAEATRVYIEQVLKNNMQRDVGRLIEMARPRGLTCPAADLDHMQRVIDQFEDRRGADMQAMTDGQVVELLLWNVEDRSARYTFDKARDGSVAGALRGVLARLRSREEQRAWMARAFQVALIRLATVWLYDGPMREFDDERLGNVLDKYHAEYDRSWKANKLQNARLVTDLAAAIDAVSGGFARDFTRDGAWRAWIEEADKLYNMLRTASLVLNQVSPLSVPLSTDPVEEPVRIKTDPVPALEPVVGTRSPFIMEISQDVLDNFQATILALGPKIDAARRLLSRTPETTAVEVAERRTGVDALRAAGVLASNAFSEEHDCTLHAYLQDAGVDTTTAATLSDLRLWAKAMAWYEWIGGWIFRGDLSDADFPADVALRSTMPYGVAEVAEPSLAKNAPPPQHYSAPMRALWSQYMPQYRAVIEKVGQMRAGRPPQLDPERVARVAKLSEYEAVVFSEMTRGIGPQTSVKFNSIWQRGPVLVFALRLYRTALETTKHSLERVIERQRDLVAATDERMRKMLRGEPMPQPVDVPYQHRRGWVEQPENSGFVRLQPIVTKGIGSAWNRLRRLAPNITDTVDIEFAQRDPQMREDFAELVAVEMAFVAQRFPKQYLQLGMRDFTDMDLRNVINRFQHNYELLPTGAARPTRPTPRAAPGAAWVADVQPTVDRREKFVLV